MFTPVCARLQLACCQAHVITQPAVYLSTYLSIEGKLQTLRRFLHGNGNYVSFLTSKQTFLRHSNKKVVRAICNYSILCDDTNRLEVISSRHYNAKSKWKNVTLEKKSPMEEVSTWRSDSNKMENWNSKDKGMSEWYSSSIESWQTASKMHFSAEGIFTDFFHFF